MSPLDASDITGRPKPLVRKSCHHQRLLQAQRSRSQAVTGAFQPTTYFITGQIFFFFFGVWTWMSNMMERVQESWWDRLQHHLTLLGNQHSLKSSCFICFFKTFTFSWRPLGLLTGLSPPPDFGAFVLFYWATCVNDVAPSSGENTTDLLQHLKSWTSLVQLCGGWWRVFTSTSVSSPGYSLRYFKVPKVCPVFLFSCFAFEFFCSVAAHFILLRIFYVYLRPTSCLTLRRHAAVPFKSTRWQHKTTTHGQPVLRPVKINGQF